MAEYVRAVSEGLKTTLELLASTPNDAAEDLLIPALDAASRELREGALRGILARDSAPGRQEIVERLRMLDEPSRAIVYDRRGRLAHAVRDAILSDDPRVVANGCEAVVWFRDYDMAPALIAAMEDEDNPQAGLAASTLLSLVEQLDLELAGPRDYRDKRDPQHLKRSVTRCLEQSVKRYAMHRRIEAIEAFLMLAARGNPTLQQILQDPLHSSYLVLVDVLRHSERAPTMRLVVGYVEEPQAPNSILHVIAHRKDRRFVQIFLETIGGEPSTVVSANLHRIDHLVWLEEDRALLDDLDDAGQHSAVQALMASSINRRTALEVIEYLVKCGKPAGRQAAVAALAKFTGAEANSLVLYALRDDDPQVQANAATQLRHRGIPGALSMLIDLVDSPHKAVRNAARDSLAEFSFKRFLAAFDLLEDDVRRSTGQLVAKIDPNTPELLREELESPSPRRRVRGLAVAAAIGMAPQYEEMLIAHLTDNDHMVRLEAAKALAECESELAQAALRSAAEDSSVAVATAANEALQAIADRPRGQREFSLSAADWEAIDD